VRLLLTAAAVCTSLVIGLTAQGPVVPKSPTPPGASSDMRETTHLVTIRGCIRGNRLKIDRESLKDALAISVLNVKDFALEGPKELLRQIKATHDNHEDEISGIVVVPPQKDRDVVTSTTKLGPKTSVNVSGKTRTEGIDSQPEVKEQTLRLRVQELRHISDRCTVPA